MIDIICMYYQLPNGKVIQITVEDYLSLTEKDIQYLISINAGDHLTNPWSGSIIFVKDKDTDDEEEIESEEQDCYFEEYFPDDYDVPDEPFELDFDR